MRTIVVAACLLALILAVPASAGDAAPAPKPPPQESVWVEFAGLPAEKAPLAADALRRVAGVREVAWSVPNAEVRVVREVGKAPDADLLGAATAAGFAAARVPVAGRTYVFQEALHCPNCTRRVSSALEALKGMKSVSVAPDRTQVVVAFDTRHLADAQVRAALEKTGYPAKP
jgi:copper chaperone CopZ